MVNPWKISLLGELRAANANRVITRFRTHKAGAVLAYLAFYCHRSHSREILIGKVWPEDEPDLARLKLRIALSSLRRQLEPPGVPAGGVIIANRSTLQLNPACIATDVAQFETLLEAARRARAEAEQIRLLGDAVAVYGGELLPGYFEGWIVPERQRLAESCFQALRHLLHGSVEAGNLPLAMEYAQRLVILDPVREEAHHELIRLLAANGSREAALRQYEELEQRLGRDLGIRPAPGITAFVQQFREQASPGGKRTEEPRDAAAGRTAAAVRSTSRHRGTADAADSRSLPSGTVTFLRADWEEPSPGGVQHRESTAAAGGRATEWMRQECERQGGCAVKQGERTLLAAFPRASESLAAAMAIQRGALSRNLLDTNSGRSGGLTTDADLFSIGSHLRVALHTGEVRLEQGEYQGLAVAHTALVLRAAQSGQLVCTEATAVMLRGEGKPSQWGFELVDLGVHGLAASGSSATVPERLFQVRTSNMPCGDSPPPQAEPAYTGDLPLRLTRFFGREREIAQLCEAIGSRPSALGEDRPAVTNGREPTAGSPRLITLTGPGGSGKTRLALEVADQLQARFRGAVWFVPLADIADPELIAPSIRDVLRLPRAPMMTPLEQVAEAFNQQPSLVVLDNFEHLVEGGSRIVGALLEQTAALSCLVTSRRRLELSEEREFIVSPLATPYSRWGGGGPSPAERPGPGGQPASDDEIAELMRCESVQLFLERAQAARADFQITRQNARAIAALCQGLEGLPLALELAAARAQLLSPGQMLAQLQRRFDFLVARKRDAPARHRALRAALDWSRELLSPELKRFFVRLFPFRGGLTSEAAEVVAGEAAALDYLEQLRGCSLITTETPRAGDSQYRMLETLREYAAEQLSPEERAAVQDRHTRYYLAFAEQAEPALRGPDQSEWLERLEDQHDNFRAALSWCREDPKRAETGLRLMGALWWFWFQRGHLLEGLAWLEAALAGRGAVSPAIRAKALLGAGGLAWRQANYARSSVLLEESRDLFEEVGDSSGRALAHIYLGLIARDQQRYAEAVDLYWQGHALCRAAGYRWGVAFALLFLGQESAVHRREYEAAAALLGESLALFRELGEVFLSALCLSFLGHFVAVGRGDFEAAEELLSQSLARFRQLGERTETAFALKALALVALRQGKPERAVALVYESLGQFRHLGHRRGIAECLEARAAVWAEQGHSDRSADRALSARPTRPERGRRPGHHDRGRLRVRLAAGARGSTLGSSR